MYILTLISYYNNNAIYISAVYHCQVDTYSLGTSTIGISYQ